MGRKWNPADHPRDGRGRFSHSASGWAGKIGDRIAATRGEDRRSRVNEDRMDQAILDMREQRRIANGDPSADEINRDTYNWDVFEKLDSIYAINDDSGDGDDDLGDIINDLETALKGGDRERASQLADEGRQHAITNGHATDDDFPSVPAPGMTPAERARQQRDDYNRKILNEAQAFQAENLGDEDGYDDFDDPDMYDSSAQDDSELQGLIDDLITVSPLPGGLESTSIPRRTPPDPDRADRLADELRRYLIANGYADDAELPSPPNGPAAPQTTDSGALVGDVVGPRMQTNGEAAAAEGPEVKALTSQLQGKLRDDGFNNPTISELLDKLHARDPQVRASAIEKAQKYLRNREQGGTSTWIDRVDSKWRSR